MNKKFNRKWKGGTPVPVLCVLCGRPAQFETVQKITDEKGTVLGEQTILNKSNLLVGEDENKQKVYCHAACYGQQHG